MPDDPAHALKLIYALKFQSKESSIVDNILILSNLKLKQGGFVGVFNKFRDCSKQLSVLEPKLDLSILTLFLMCTLETSWKSHHGSASEKLNYLAELNRKRADPQLSLPVLQEFFESLEALSPQDKLKADQPAPLNDFAGAVTGRGAGGKGGKKKKKEARAARAELPADGCPYSSLKSLSSPTRLRKGTPRTRTSVFGLPEFSKPNRAKSAGSISRASATCGIASPSTSTPAYTSTRKARGAPSPCTSAASLMSSTRLAC